MAVCKIYDFEYVLDVCIQFMKACIVFLSTSLLKASIFEVHFAEQWLPFRQFFSWFFLLNQLYPFYSFHSTAPLYCWGDKFQSHIFKKGGIRKKMKAWGDLKGSCHRYLLGRPTVSCQKGLCKIEYGSR